MTGFFRYRTLIIVIPAQAGIHPARITLEARSGNAARPWISGLRPG